MNIHKLVNRGALLLLALAPPARASGLRCGQAVLGRPPLVIETQMSTPGGVSSCIVNDGILFARTDRPWERVLMSHIHGARTLLDFAALNGKKVLDAGCGKMGTFVRELREHGVDAVGIDLNVEDSVDRAFLHNGDILAMDFADQTFDVIISTWSLLSYLPRIRSDARLVKFKQALRELIRTTKIGGVILVGEISMSRYSFGELMSGVEGVEFLTNQRHQAIGLRRVR